VAGRSGEWVAEMQRRVSAPEPEDIEPGHFIAFYQAVERIGQGGFGDVWKVYDNGSKKFFALKLEPVTTRSESLSFEITVLKSIQSSQRFPRHILDGVHAGRKYLVEELLGPNLHMVVSQITGYLICSPYLPRLADEMLLCIRDFHNCGYVHRDIKPENFVVRLNGEVPICLVDFGNARQFQRGGQLIGARDRARAPGSPMYASPNLSRHIELSRRDDLISWIYSIVALSGNPLPWASCQSREEMTLLKERHTLVELCSPLPPCFTAIAEHITQLDFASAPNYDMMRALLARDMPSTGQPFEWMEIQTEGFDPGGNWDPTGFLVSISPFLQEKKDGCLLL
jgi:serine/threonine protein kinase